MSPDTVIALSFVLLLVLMIFRVPIFLGLGVAGIVGIYLVRGAVE